MPLCAACGQPLPRFPELWGQLQQLDAVLHAWDGDAQPLAMLLPERPRFVGSLTLPDSSEGDKGAPAHAALAHERRGDAADADMELAGDTAAACWNRASLAVHREIARTPGLPGKSAIAAARALAGAPSPFWTDQTIGRLVWSLVSERVLARREVGEMMDFDLSQLREAEDLFEFATFWDRAMVLVTYSRLELTGDTGRVALPLAREVAAALLAEPPMRGAALAEFAAAVTAAYDAASQRLPRPAWRALYLWMRDERLKQGRMPCAGCGKGTFGVERSERDGAGGESFEG